MSAVAERPRVAGAPSDSRPSGRLSRRSRGWIQSGVALIAGLGLWELVGQFLLTNRTFFVPFSTTAREIGRLASHGALWTDIRVSVIELAVGFAAAAVVGIIVGTAMGLSSKVRAALGFWVDVFNATPVLAIAPLFILMFGIGMPSKFVFVGFVTVWTVILNTMSGFVHEDAEALEMARSFGSTSGQEFRYIRVPAAIPSVAVGLRVGLGHATAGVVVGELFGATAGLGYLLFSAQDQFNTAGVFAAIVVLAIIALIAVQLMTLLERRLSRWRH